MKQNIAMFAGIVSFFLSVCRNCFLTPVGESGLHDDIVPVSQASSFTVDNIHSGENLLKKFCLPVCFSSMQTITMVHRCCVVEVSESIIAVC